MKRGAVARAIAVPRTAETGLAFLVVLAVVATLMLSYSRLALSEPPAPIDETVRAMPIQLTGGSQLTLISPDRWSSVADSLSSSLTATHEQYRKLFGTIPPVKSSIRLMEEEDFYTATGAPRWTNALYFRGQIIIPLSMKQPVDLDNVRRSVKHEYTHAVISSLSSGRAPGWLDEGIAQWAEGSENPALKPALTQWLQRHEPVPLKFLQGGFTRLDADMVPAAYAQSLYAAYTVIHTFGFVRLSDYMKELRSGADKREAFESAFSMSEDAFEDHLGAAFRAWVAEATHPEPASPRRLAGSR